MEQQQARNPREEIPLSGAERIQLEFKKLLDRYPTCLDEAKRGAFLSDVRLLITKGTYRSADGVDQVDVTEIGLSDHSDRPVDVCVTYISKNGRLASGTLPIVFFLEMHRFIRLDLASM